MACCAVNFSLRSERPRSSNPTCRVCPSDVDPFDLVPGWMHHSYHETVVFPARSTNCGEKGSVWVPVPELARLFLGSFVLDGSSHHPQRHEYDVCLVSSRMRHPSDPNSIGKGTGTIDASRWRTCEFLLSMGSVRSLPHDAPTERAGILWERCVPWLASWIRPPGLNAGVPVPTAPFARWTVGRVSFSMDRSVLLTPGLKDPSIQGSCCPNRLFPVGFGWEQSMIVTSHSRPSITVPLTSVRITKHQVPSLTVRGFQRFQLPCSSGLLVGSRVQHSSKRPHFSLPVPSDTPLEYIRWGAVLQSHALQATYHCSVL
eukprot:scaffold641_cov373-Pavlova_lutheri.AAC.9